MSTGIDYAWAQAGQPSDATLHAAGVTFVCRYLSSDASKRIGAVEAARHLAAGRQIVLVWEDEAGAVKYGHARGVADAQAADAQAKAAGLSGAPVYFACDYDAPAGDQTLINAYLDGAASVIGKARVGLYGGFWPLSRARTAGKATYWWGTPAWSGSNWGSAGWKPHLMQGTGTTIGGVSCDWDVANAADFGQYKHGTGPLAEPTISAGSGAFAAVVAMQRRLNMWGAHLTEDGQFGALSTTALKAFQAGHGLTADGICGPASWAKLELAPPASDGRHHGEWISAGQLALDDLATSLGYSTNTLLRMTAVHYGAYDPVLAGWLHAVLTGAQPHSTPLPAGAKVWCD
jgi:peptidoglycan hydrolase-like protein with peptidoglycan-binding domain